MEAKDVMNHYFTDLDRAARNRDRKIAWCTSAGPAEILRAMDFEVFFPENHGAMLGATRMSADTIVEANAHGYSPDICSYLTSDIGAYLKGVTPLTKAYGIASVPRPDVLVYNTNQCKDVMHWFEFYSRQFQVPVFGIHSPSHLPEVKQHHIDDVVRQFRELITRLEKLTGKRLVETRLEEVLSLSKEATDLWGAVLESAKSKPSPLSFFDGTIYMGPIVVLRGTEIARDFYRRLLRDLGKKQEKKEAAVPGERARIYWEGMPIWGRLRALSELFKRNHACVVASTYCNSWVFSGFDPSQPLSSMAKAYLEIFINRNDGYKQEYIERVVKEYAIDGVIFHDSKTCPNNCNSQYNLPNRLRQHGVRAVIINGDLCDLRCFSDDQTSTIVEAFLETLE